MALLIVVWGALALIFAISFAIVAIDLHHTRRN